MSMLEFEKDGIPIQVVVPQELEFKKTLKGEWKATCPKCETAELELKERYLQETEPSKKRLPGFELVKNGKRAAEIVSKLSPCKDLTKRWRERNEAVKIRQNGASDIENWDFILTCPICYSDFHLTAIAKNPVQYEERGFLDELKEAVQEGGLHDGLTLKCLARIASVRNQSPESYIVHVEKVLADYGRYDGFLQKVNSVIAESKILFQSGIMNQFISLTETDLQIAGEQLKKEFESELNTIIKEMFDASFVQFPAPEESLPEKIVHRFKRNEATLAF